MKILQTLSVFALMTACAADDTSLADQRADESPSTAALVGGDDGDAIARPPACQGLQEAASTVLNAYQQCTSDADCAVEHVRALCLNNFMCPVPINAKSDLARLHREAEALSFAYQRACTTHCAVASCAGPSRTVCDSETKRCKNIFVRASASE